MSKLSLEHDGIRQLQALLDTVEDSQGELTKDQQKLRKQCIRALTPLKHASAKAKGRDLQKFICKEIGEITGIPYDQQDDCCLIHSREMGQAGSDVILRGEALKKFPYSIECKNTESLALYNAIEQVWANTREGTDWAVIHKKKNSKPIIVLEWEAFKKLYTKKGV